MVFTVKAGKGCPEQTSMPRHRCHGEGPGPDHRHACAPRIEGAHPVLPRNQELPEQGPPARRPPPGLPAGASPLILVAAHGAGMLQNRWLMRELSTPFCPRHDGLNHLGLWCHWLTTPNPAQVETVDKSAPRIEQALSAGSRNTRSPPSRGNTRSPPTRSPPARRFSSPTHRPPAVHTPPTRRTHTTAATTAAAATAAPQ